MVQQSVPSTSDITQDDKLWAALGYPIFIIALIMLFIEGKKDRPFIKYHAVQALALAVVVIIIEILIGILSSFLGFLGILFNCLAPLVWLALIWPAVLAYQGKYFEIPVVTNFLRGQHWIA